MRHRFYISAENIRLLTSSRHALETLDLFFDLFLRFLVRVQLFQLFHISIGIFRPAVISQFLTDHF